MKVLAIAAIVVVLGAGAGLWWFFKDDAPDAVSLGAGVSQVEEGSAGTSETRSAGDEGIAGTWVVDAATGDFDFEQATGTFVGFRINEQLAGIGSAQAVGRTGDVTGSVTFDEATLTAATFEADMRTITTNESRRDDRVQRALQTSTHPKATFRLTKPVDVGDAADAGGPLKATATGELTIRGVTRVVDVALEAQRVNDTIVVVGSTEITFSDFDVEVPDSQAVLSVEDHGTVEFQILLTRG